MLTPRRSARGTGERRARVALPFGTVFGRIAEWSCGAPGWPTLTSAAALRRINHPPLAFLPPGSACHGAPGRLNPARALKLSQSPAHLNASQAGQCANAILSGRPSAQGIENDPVMPRTHFPR